MRWNEPFLLFDDARGNGGAIRLYRRPRGEVAAYTLDEVRPALERLRRELAAGRYAAGFLAYEAGYALEPRLEAIAPQVPGPLLWFGLFDDHELLDDHAMRAFLPNPAGAWIGRPRPRIARGDYLAAVTKVHDHLRSGDFYQANLTFRCDVPLLGPPLAAYARLRSSARAGWGGVIRHPNGWILSCSPEQFFIVNGGTVEARPMKGTAPRRAASAADADEVRGLAADPKQRAENLMIVDLLRNDLARVSEPGSVEVPELFEVETYPTVHQMVSLVRSRLREGLNAVDIIETIFPCGSVTGAPKISAMEHLRRLEAEPRGAYTGSMGWIEPGGDAAFNVMIRTLELADGSDHARLGLGSGLVVDSNAADEWEECRLKGEYVTRAAEPVDLIETMRFDPHDGIVELDRHLDRLGHSAQTLGFIFDRHGARNELQAATFGKKQRALARLLLSPSGAMAIEVRPLDETPAEPVAVAARPLPVDPGDFRLRHKTTARRFYDEAAAECGAFEVVFTDCEGRVTEGSFTTVFVEREGTLLTPPIERGLLPGILRAMLIEQGRAVEQDLTLDDLQGGFLIGNSVRGLIRAELVSGS